jgi:hypothetical protein
MCNKIGIAHSLLNFSIKRSDEKKLDPVCDMQQNTGYVVGGFRRSCRLTFQGINIGFENYSRSIICNIDKNKLMATSLLKLIGYLQ